MEGVGVVVHVPQGPGEDMIQALLEGEGVGGLREEDLSRQSTNKVRHKFHTKKNTAITLTKKSYLTLVPLEGVADQVLPMVVQKSC